MCTQLKINAAIQEGMRPKFMPAEWFNTPEEGSFDWSNPLQSSIRLMEASYIMDCGDIEKYIQLHSKVMSSKEMILFTIELLINNNNSASASAAAAAGVGGRVKRKYSLLLDILMICFTGGLWIIWMILRPKYY